MYDTIKIVNELEQIPKQARELQQTPFDWNGFLWIPHFKDSNTPLYYKSKFKNLSMRLVGSQLYITNSLHKSYHGNNYCSFSYVQVCKAIILLDNQLPINIYAAKILKLSVGIVIKESPQLIFNEWLYYLGKPFTPMKNYNKIYGAKFYLTDYSIKGYDKTYEVKNHNQIQLNDKYFRFEIEGKTKIFNNKTNNIGIHTVNDLLDYSKYIKLGNLLKDKYQKIEKHSRLNLSELTIKQKRLIASISNSEIKESIRKQHPDTYKKDRKEYNKIIQNSQKSIFQNQVMQKINQQINYSINN